MTTPFRPKIQFFALFSFSDEFSRLPPPSNTKAAVVHSTASCFIGGKGAYGCLKMRAVKSSSIFIWCYTRWNHARAQLFRFWLVVDRPESSKSWRAQLLRLLREKFARFFWPEIVKNRWIFSCKFQFTPFSALRAPPNSVLSRPCSVLSPLSLQIHQKFNKWNKTHYNFWKVFHFPLLQMISKNWC